MQVLKAFKDLFASAQCEHSCKLSKLRVLREQEETASGPRTTALNGQDLVPYTGADEGSVFYMNEFGF